MQRISKALLIRRLRYIPLSALFLLLAQCTHVHFADFAPSSGIAATQYPTILAAQTRKDAMLTQLGPARKIQETLRHGRLIRANMRPAQPLGQIIPPLRVAPRLSMPIVVIASERRKPQPLMIPLRTGAASQRQKQSLQMTIAKGARKPQSLDISGQVVLAAAQRRASALQKRRVE